MPFAAAGRARKSLNEVVQDSEPERCFPAETQGVLAEAQGRVLATWQKDAPWDSRERRANGVVLASFAEASPAGRPRLLIGVLCFCFCLVSLQIPRHSPNMFPSPGPHPGGHSHQRRCVRTKDKLEPHAPQMHTPWNRASQLCGSGATMDPGRGTHNLAELELGAVTDGVEGHLPRSAGSAQGCQGAE